MNGANEVAVAAFLGKRCEFGQIVRTIEYALDKAQFIASPSLDELEAANREARRLAAEFLHL